MKAIVTVKLPHDPNHNPHNKKSGIRPLIQRDGSFCTDTTGAHHSIILEGSNLKDISEQAKVMFHHVTRIEVVE